MVSSDRKKSALNVLLSNFQVSNYAVLIAES